MSNGMTIDSLYEAFMDIDEEGVSTGPTPFAEDVFEFFGKPTLDDLEKEAWAATYGMYLPTWDPTQIHLAERERDLDYRSAMDTLKTTQAATERVYATEMDTLSTSLGKELGKGREMASKTGIRSGGLESAMQDTIATTGSKAEDFGDRARISQQEIDDKYNVAMVDAALDFDKAERQEKEEFYDRTMSMIMRLMDTGAFDAPTCPQTGLPPDIICSEDSGNPGATVCSTDECNEYGTVTPVGEEIVIQEAISTCVQEGYSQEVCEQYAGDTTQIVLDFGHGSIEEEGVEIISEGLETIGTSVLECLNIGACRAAAYPLCAANIFTNTEDCVTRNCGKAC